VLRTSAPESRSHTAIPHRPGQCHDVTFSPSTRSSFLPTASGSSPSGLPQLEQMPQRRRNAFTWQLTALLFIGIIEFSIPCSMHGRKKGELSQGHTRGSQPGSSLQDSSKLRKLPKTEKQKPETTEKGMTWKPEERTKRRMLHLVL